MTSKTDILREQLRIEEDKESQALAKEATIFIESYIKFSKKYTTKKTNPRTYLQLDFNKLKGAKVDGLKIGGSQNGAYVEVI
jgi:hypothetical protein